MRPLFAFALGLFSSLAVLRAAPVDFTPHPDFFLRDGVTFHQVKFHQGRNEILYRPPQGWNCTGNPDAATLRPDDESTVRAAIKHQELPKFVPAFDDDGLKALRAQAQALIPPLPQLKLVEERQNPKTMSNHETMDYTFSGVMFARNYKFYVFLVPMEGEELSFVLYAEEKEFEDASKAFFHSISTFQFN